MYLRGLRSRLVYVQNQQFASKLGKRPRAALFSSTQARCVARPGDGQQHHQHDPQQTHDSKNNGRFAPIRPITLFAICIPLGYALNWIIKQQHGEDNGVTSDGFVKYTLASKEDISSTCSIFTLIPATSSPIDVRDPSFERMITSVQFKQPQLQICRNYTLLPRQQGQDAQHLRFLIRRERNGEVSGYLHRLPVGAQIEVRGVFPEYKLPSNIVKAVFVAGGTGIAPAMQGAEILAGESDVHILWASRRREDCQGGRNDTTPPWNSGWGHLNWWQSKAKAVVPQEKGTIVSEIDNLKQTSNFEHGDGRKGSLSVDYFVDEEETFIQARDVQRLLQGDGTTTAEGSHTDRKILFVSGPDGFMNHWAAPKQWQDGREVQGRLGGVLSTLDLNGWEVVKL